VENGLLRTGLCTYPQYHLKQLLKPNGTTPDTGIEGRVLQNLYSILESAEVVNSCKQDCRSVVVRATGGPSTTLAIPTNGIKIATSTSMEKMPPLDADVNVTIPQLSKRSEVCNVQYIVIICNYEFFNIRSFLN
jgi:hypothetical protein